MNINYLLWVVQVLLAVTFLFAGGMKIFLPLGALTFPIPLPWALIRFLSAAEVLGAIGLVLPWLLGIRPVLTPIAAAGLMPIVTGATVITLVGEGVAPALFPLILMLLCALVTYGRWPHHRTMERNANPDLHLKSTHRSSAQRLLWVAVMLAIFGAKTNSWASSRPP